MLRLCVRGDTKDSRLDQLIHSVIEHKTRDHTISDFVKYRCSCSLLMVSGLTLTIHSIFVRSLFVLFIPHPDLGLQTLDLSRKPTLVALNVFILISYPQGMQAALANNSGSLICSCYFRLFFLCVFFLWLLGEGLIMYLLSSVSLFQSASSLRCLSISPASAVCPARFFISPGSACISKSIWGLYRMIRYRPHTTLSCSF